MIGVMDSGRYGINVENNSDKKETSGVRYCSDLVSGRNRGESERGRKTETPNRTEERKRESRNEQRATSNEKRECGSTACALDIRFPSLSLSLIFSILSSFQVKSVGKVCVSDPSCLLLL